MKKLLVLLLALTMVLGLGAQAASARSDNAGGNNSQQGQYGYFSDTKGHWAEDSIDKMAKNGFVKGYGDGTFQPNKPVTEIEAIVMIVRAMGLEDDALDADIDDVIDDMFKVPDWAAGYLQVAWDEDVITATELNDFQPNQGAKRAMLALWLSRALDLDDYIDEDTELPFLDKVDIPDDMYDAVVLMYEAGLMKGDGNNFQPNKPITRAEMAVLLDRIDESDADDFYFANTKFIGFITNVDDDSITVERWDIAKTFDFADEVSVTLDGESVDIDDLTEGLHVKLILNSEGEVTDVNACTPLNEDLQMSEILTEYEGEITDIDISDGTDYISIEIDSISYTFEVRDNTVILYKGDKVGLDDLIIGGVVKIKADNDVAIRIVAEPGAGQTEEDYEGNIVAIYDDKIVIEDESGETFTFDVKSETDITLNGDEADLNELQAGDLAEIAALGDNAVTIDAEREED